MRLKFKQAKRLYFLVLTAAALSATAQTSVEISTEKTCSLVFPSPIRQIDRGSQQLLVQQLKKSPCILLLKAAAADIPSTNLNVTTADNSHYSFVVHYREKPAFQVYELPILDLASTASYAKSIIDNPPTIRGVFDRKWGIKAAIAGLYVKDHILFYQLTIENHSPLDYEIDQLHVMIKNLKEGKKNSVHEMELSALYVLGNRQVIRASSQTTIVLAFEKHSIPEAKFLSMEITEKNGGRDLRLKISNKQLMKAIRLPDYQ